MDGSYKPADPAAPRFRLTMSRSASRKQVEARSTSMDALLDLSDQLVALGYQFHSLKRIEGDPPK